MTKHVIISVLFALALSDIASAAPSITGVSGTVNNGSSITISGSGFGSKSTAAPSFWDTVDNQTAYSGLSNGAAIPTGGSNPWAGACNSGGGGNGGCMTYSTTPSDLRTTLRSAVYSASNTTYGNLTGKYVSSPTTDLYVSFWVYLSQSLGSATAKLARLGDAAFTHGFSYTSGGDYWFTSAGGQCNEMTYCSYAPPHLANYCTDLSGLTGGGWHHVEMLMHSDATWASAWYSTYVDGAISSYFINSSYQNTTDPVPVSCSPQASWNWDGIYLLGTDGTTTWSNVRLSDIYLDNTFQRVAICSGSTWANRGHCEMQPATSWADGAATITVNRGSFASGAGAYAYVVDSTNTANSSGYAITFGADTTPPTITAFTMPSTATSTTVNVSSFTATDAVGVTGYCITTTNSSSGCSWSGSAPTTATGSAGANTWYAWAKDAAGNVSTASTASTTIALASLTAHVNGHINGSLK